jgi:hypothetical protein
MISQKFDNYVNITGYFMQKCYKYYLSLVYAIRKRVGILFPITHLGLFQIIDHPIMA